MKVLVTGMSGFVGWHCAHQLDTVDLAAEGWIDMRDASAVRHAVSRARFDAVIHLAALSSVSSSLEDPRRTYEVNFLGTLHLLEALRHAGFRGRLLYVGSAEIYGIVAEEELPIEERYPARPLNPYSVSKVAAEALCYQWSQTGPFEIVVARPFNHVGPRQSTLFAVSDFARQIVGFARTGGGGRLLVGDIDTTRDFTDVRDIVRAYAGLLRDGRNGEAYNVCSGTERSMREIITALCRLGGVQAEIVVDPQRLRPAQQRRMRGSFAKLAADTGWSPLIPFERTLHDIINYWQNEGDST